MAGDGHAHAATSPRHFAHPLVTESPMPENEARLSFEFDRLADGGTGYTLEGTGEVALSRWFSIEASAPITFLDNDASSDEFGLGNTTIGVKFASFAFENSGILLAAGLEVGLPTGDDAKGIGSNDTIEFEPWVGFGYQHDDWEWIGRVGVGLPTTSGTKEADEELEWATSLLYHFNESVAALVELDGTRAFGGEEDGYDNVSITPGLRFYPSDDRDVSIGVGMRLPLTDDRESDVQGIVTVYFHF